MNIWIDENIPMGQEAFAPHGRVFSFAGRKLSRGDLSSAEALLVRSVTRVNAELLQGTPVRFVGTATIGTDHIDLPYLAARGIGFASAPGSNAGSVAEYVTAALLHLSREKGFSPEGGTMGLVGWGNVGRQVEKKAVALGMQVLRCDPPLKEAAPGKEKAGFFVALEELLARSDVVSLHVPLTETGAHATKGMAGADFFRMPGRPIVFINTCRGETVREGDLRKAREQGLVKHMILDVFSGEPLIDPGLCRLADITTPHIAGYSLDGKLNGTTLIADAFCRHFGLAPAPGFIRPRPADSEIAYSGEEDWEFLRLCVERAYDLPADDARLRKSLLEPDPGGAFDALRRKYPVRHEFSAYSIAGLPPGKSGLRARLAALGFEISPK